jgi:SAM-dependent methyltransferase
MSKRNRRKPSGDRSNICPYSGGLPVSHDQFNVTKDSDEISNLDPGEPPPDTQEEPTTSTEYAVAQPPVVPMDFAPGGLTGSSWLLVTAVFAMHVFCYVDHSYLPGFPSEADGLWSVNHATRLLLSQHATHFCEITSAHMERYVRYPSRLFTRLSKRVNLVVRSGHECNLPFYTSAQRLQFALGDYGGVAGTIMLASFSRILHTITYKWGGLYRLLTNESVFVDVGSGTGMPVFIMACLQLRYVFGFDICPLIVSTSYDRFKKLSGIQGLFNTNAYLFTANCNLVRTLGNATHVYIFAGCVEHFMACVDLILLSPCVVLFAAVVTHRDYVTSSGCLCRGDTDVEELKNLNMSGSSHTGYVMPMTKVRRARMQQARRLMHLVQHTTPVARDVDLMGKVDYYAENPSDYTVYAQHEFESTRDPNEPPVTRASERAREAR